MLLVAENAKQESVHVQLTTLCGASVALHAAAPLISPGQDSSTKIGRCSVSSAAAAAAAAALQSKVLPQHCAATQFTRAHRGCLHSFDCMFVALQALTFCWTAATSHGCWR
jgi:hypothetical protein